MQQKCNYVENFLINIMKLNNFSVYNFQLDFIQQENITLFFMLNTLITSVKGIYLSNMEIGSF